MTVHEMIEKLKTFPPDLVVYAESDYGISHWICVGQEVYDDNGVTIVENE